MKTFYLLFVFGIILSSSANASISLSDEQFKNIGLLHEALKKKDANFVGLNGSKDQMQVNGISDKDALKEIAKLDIPKEILARKSSKNLKIKSLRDKLTALGLTEDDMGLMNLPQQEA